MLAKLPDLDTLILTRGLAKGGLGLDILQAVFSHCKNLKYVDVEVGGGGSVRLHDAPKTKGYWTTAPRVSFPESHGWHDTAHPEIDGYM